MRERRHLIAIVVLIMVLSVLFQLSAIVKGKSLAYTSNDAVNATGLIGQITGSQSFDASSGKGDPSFDAARRHVAFVGDAKSAYLPAVQEFATYGKWAYETAPSLSSWCARYEKDGFKGWQLVVIDPAAAQWDRDIDLIRKVQQAKVTVVLCDLPDEKVVAANEGLRELLGIAEIRQESVEVKGLHLFEGLLLGGSKVYRDGVREERGFFERLFFGEGPVEDEHLLDEVQKETPWYNLLGGSKIYLRAEVDTDVYPDTFAHDDRIPPLMWRYSEGAAPLFVAYGDVLSRVGGFGLLTAFVGESSDCELWPVANAQVLALFDYPVLARENDAEMERRYQRDSVSVQRDIVWSSIAALAHQRHALPTFLMVPELTEGNPDPPSDEILRFYMRSVGELGGEVGLACDAADESASPAKVERDLRFLRTSVPNYDFVVAGIRTEGDFTALQKADDELQGLHTLVSGMDEGKPVVGYASDSVIRLGAVSDCWHYGALDDLALRACETGFGYSCVTFDLRGLTHPASEEDEWQNGYRKMLASYSSYWKPYDKLRQATASEAGAYVREALSVDYEASREGNAISVTYSCAGNGAEVPFFLRLHDEHVVSVEGGSFVELDDDFFALTLNGGKAVVHVESDIQPTVVMGR